MKSDPVVTVLLPVFNGEDYIAASVDSMSAQTYENLDILVIEDGSTDGTLASLRRLQVEDSRIRIATRENRGLIRTLNEGLDLARGSLVARMDADDNSYPTRIERQEAKLRQNPNPAIFGTHLDYIVASNRVMSLQPPQVTAAEVEAILDYLLARAPCGWSFASRSGGSPKFAARRIGPARFPVQNAFLRRWRRRVMEPADRYRIAIAKVCR